MRTYEADEVDAMLARAVAAEREACAAVAEDCGAIHVAKRIRARSQAAAQEQ